MGAWDRGECILCRYTDPWAVVVACLLFDSNTPRTIQTYFRPGAQHLPACKHSFHRIPPNTKNQLPPVGRGFRWMWGVGSTLFLTPFLLSQLFCETEAYNKNSWWASSPSTRAIRYSECPSDLDHPYSSGSSATVYQACCDDPRTRFPYYCPTEDPVLEKAPRIVRRGDVMKTLKAYASCTSPVLISTAF